MLAQKNAAIIDMVPTICMGRDDSAWERTAGSYLTNTEFRTLADWVANTFMPTLDSNIPDPTVNNNSDMGDMLPGVDDSMGSGSGQNGGSGNGGTGNGGSNGGASSNGGTQSSGSNNGSTGSGNSGNGNGTGN